MKLYLTIALVALLFNFGAAKHLPRNNNLRASASDDVVVQETAAESDLLDNNVVDNEALVHNDESGSNSVNLLTNQPELTLVQNAPTKTLSTVSHANLVSAPTKTLTPVQTVSVQTVPQLQSAQLHTVNVLKSQAPVQNLVTKSAPLATSKTVVWNNQAPSQTLYTVPQTQSYRYYQVTPQQQQQQQQVVYSVQQPQTQQYVWNQVPSQQVSYQAQPQQQYVNVQAQQPQQQYVSVQAQPQQNQQQLVLLRNRQPTTSSRSTNLWVDQTPTTNTRTSNLWVDQTPTTNSRSTNLWVDQTPTTNTRTSNLWVDQTPTLSRPSTLQLVQPAQLTKTRAPNPLVYQVQPSRQTSLSRQTVLSGAQLSSDVADESRSSDFVVQEAESSY